MDFVPHMMLKKSQNITQLTEASPLVWMISVQIMLKICVFDYCQWEWQLGDSSTPTFAGLLTYVNVDKHIGDREAEN